MNKQFEEWWDNQDRYTNSYVFSTISWYQFTDDGFPFEYKWGVYLEFFDSVGIMLRTPPNKAYISGRKTHYYLVEHKHIEYSDKEEYTRTEAQKAAIKKAFEILNKQK